jgi:amino acid transporter
LGGPAPRSAARLSLFDCVAIGVNGIVGSGIFLLPGRLAEAAGPWSIAAFLLCGALCGIIALCFAEASGMFDRSGGPYVYARAAFGEPAGFAVGWMALASGVLGMSAVARGLAQAASGFMPALADPAAQGAAAAVFLIALGALNAAGLRAGAGASDLFSVAKLVPLRAFVGVGIAHVRGDLLAGAASLGDGAAGSAASAPFSASGLASAVFIAVFALSGFEVIPVPAGETADARRTVPISVLASLGGAAILYALVQTVAVGTDPNLARSATPLVDAARAFAGPAGAAVIAAGGVVSMGGYCAGSALVVPRYFVALAEDRLLPRALAARSARTHAPLAAIALTTLVGAALSATLDFDRLVDITNVSLLFQYVPTCVAVLVLRRTRPDLPRRWRLPWGPAIPLLATITSIALVVVARPGRAELATGAIYLAAGGIVYGLLRAGRAARA